MKFTILTLFPEMFEPLRHSVFKRALDRETLALDIVNIRDYSGDRHQKCDDVPFGGGAGMLMTPQPIYDAINAVDPGRKMRRIYLSPKGERLSNALAEELAAENGDLLLLCGHYEGVDQRVLDLCIDREISIGDYVLTGGELAAMVLCDCVARFVPGVLGSAESSADDSFKRRLLEYPQYTRPQSFMGMEVPEVLLSGHHANIEKWRRQKSREETAKKRPDLLNDQ